MVGNEKTVTAVEGLRQAGDFDVYPTNYFDFGFYLFLLLLQRSVGHNDFLIATDVCITISAIAGVETPLNKGRKSNWIASPFRKQQFTGDRRTL